MLSKYIDKTVFAQIQLYFEMVIIVCSRERKAFVCFLYLQLNCFELYFS